MRALIFFVFSLFLSLSPPSLSLPPLSFCSLSSALPVLLSPFPSLYRSLFTLLAHTHSLFLFRSVSIAHSLYAYFFFLSFSPAFLSHASLSLARYLFEASESSVTRSATSPPTLRSTTNKIAKYTLTRTQYTRTHAHTHTHTHQSQIRCFPTWLTGMLQNVWEEGGGCQKERFL